MMSEIWKVFLPYQLLSAHCGYLVGSVHEKTRHVFAHCVITYGEFKKSNEKPNSTEDVSSSLSPGEIIGSWHTLNMEHGCTPDHKMKLSLIPNCISNEFWLMAQEKMSKCLSCDFYSCQKGGNRKLKCHCILYDPLDVLSSYVICGKSTSFLNFTSTLPECNPPNPVEAIADKTMFQQDCKQLQRNSPSAENIASLVVSLTKFKHFHVLELDRNTVVTSWVRENGCWYIYMSLWVNSLFQRFSGIFPFVGGMFDNLFTNKQQIEYWIDVPSLTRQLRLRYRQRKNVAAFMSHKNSLKNLLYADVSWQQLMDTVVGVVFMMFMMQTGKADSVADFVMMWADEVGSSLTSLINWLMGAPAGLKLNSQLTQFLGHFFLYHIYLWTGYLSILRPILGSLLYYSSTLGLLGFSVQLCLIQDILSMLTLHIYCFYVYAARLYSLQVFALASLWRLFRGKKWNVLRHRVDSASYDIDQLFVGTLFFTLLLFLLPTMLLYYIVFLVLRLAVLFVKGVLSACVRTINATPVFTIILWILRSKAITGDIQLTVVPDSCTDSTLIFTMQTSHLPLTKLLKSTKIWTTLTFQQEKLSWLKLLHNIVNGRLIYPWIQSSPSQE